MKNLSPMKNTKTASTLTDAQELTISRKQARKAAKQAKNLRNAHTQASIAFVDSCSVMTRLEGKTATYTEVYGS